MYIKLDKIPAFAQIVHTIKVNFVLVSGCSDYTTPNDLFRSNDEFLKFVNSPNIIKWFIQNCIVKHEKITLLPIGLDYHTMSERDMEWGSKTTPLEQEKILQDVISKVKSYWENGQLFEIYTYIDDKKNGEFKEYYEDGQLSYIGSYIDDKIIDGKKLNKKEHTN